MNDSKSSSENEINTLRNELEILSSLFLKINMDIDLDDFLNEIIFTLRERINFDGCNFAFLSSDGYMKIHRIDPSMISKKSRISEEYLTKVYSKKIDFKTSEDWAAVAARENREIYIPEIFINELNKDERDFVENYGITGLYYLPIPIPGRACGTMRLHNYESTMYLSDNEKQLIKRRAAIVGKAMENYYLYNDLKRKNEKIEVDMRLSEKLQRSLLPQSVPDLPEVEIATAYIPMFEVGGDFFDFMYSPKKKIESSFGLLLTDASGHGVSAAFIATMLKMSFQNKDVYRKSHSPGKVFHELNRSLMNRTAGNFVTGCYAYFDLRKMKMIISSAGHEPVYRINRKNGEIEKIKPSGKVLGLFNSPWYEEREIDIVSHDRFLFYTDGLVEAINRDGIQFREILDQICRESIHLSAEDFCSNVIRQLKEHSLDEMRKSFDDDVALVIIDMI